ncbi:MAG: hypothetical protein GY951_01080 [Psychromonas sp.]|nr:hypothetical protein [Psychromonas sp.]
MSTNPNKLDLQLPDSGQLELFSFPNPPKTFSIKCKFIQNKQLVIYYQKLFVEDIPVDEFSGIKFTFFNAHSDLPLLLYEQIITIYLE